MFSVVCVRLSFHIGAREGVPPYSEASCNYHPQTKLREGNAFTPVCHSVHRGKVYINGKTLSPLGRHPPSGQTSPEMATEAGGAHPTGVQSCFHVISYNFFFFLSHRYYAKSHIFAQLINVHLTLIIGGSYNYLLGLKPGSAQNFGNFPHAG